MIKLVQLRSSMPLPPLLISKKVLGLNLCLQHNSFVQHDATRSMAAPPPLPLEGILVHCKVSLHHYDLTSFPNTYNGQCPIFILLGGGRHCKSQLSGQENNTVTPVNALTQLAQHLAIVSLNKHSHCLQDHHQYHHSLQHMHIMHITNTAIIFYKNR